MAPTLRCGSMRRLPIRLRELFSMETKPTWRKQGSSWKNTKSAKPRRGKPSLEPAPFEWTPERTLELLISMIGLKPTGLHKQANVKLIRARVSYRLKMNVPIQEVWKFLHAHWDLNLAEQIETGELKREIVPKQKCFEEDGAKLAQEAAQTQMSQPSTSRDLSDITKLNQHSNTIIDIDTDSE